MSTLTTAEIESLRIAIAEECGWEIDASCPTWFEHGWHRPTAEHTEDCTPVPPYTTSIDAIQAAAIERFRTGPEIERFNAALEDRQTSEANQCLLTALDWCIAFARTAKIWRYRI